MVTNCKGLLRRDSRDVHQQHSRSGQRGLCDDYLAWAVQKKVLVIFSSSLTEAYGTGALIIYGREGR